MAKINLYTQKWCDLVFVNKNKEYGAYEMRKLSGRRHLFAILIVFIVCGLALALPTIIESVVSKKGKEVMTEVTNLSSIQTEVKESVVDRIIPPDVPQIKSSMKFTAPVIKKDDEVREEDEMKRQEELVKSDVTISVVDVKGNNEDEGKLLVETIVEVVEETGSVAEPYVFVEQMPEYPGGEAALAKYLAKTIVYPPIAQENGIMGTVYVSFVVCPDGSIAKVKVVRGIDKSCDEEAIRAISKMPHWKPGRQNGRAVYVQYNVPVKFILQNR